MWAARRAGTSEDGEGGGFGPPVPTFPNARYVVQRMDLADAAYPNERTAATYFSENWEPLAERGLLDVVDGPQRFCSYRAD